MTLSHSHLAYGAEFDHLDAALAAPRGIRLPFPTYAAAATYRHRLHHARALDRKRNLEIYEEGNDLRGTSPYDPLVCKIKARDDRWFIYIEPSGGNVAAEEIPEDDVDPEPPLVERQVQPSLPATPLLIGFKRRI